MSVCACACFADRSGVTARFKPQARRLEMSLPLDTSGENYGDADENKRITALTLRSTAVDDSGASYAVGVVRDNQLLLLPLDYTLQVRLGSPGGKGSLCSHSLTIDKLLQ